MDLIELIKDFPWFTDIVILMGTLRIVMKPLFSLIDAVINATPSKKDDEAWDGVKGSKAFASLVWLIDYVASVKIPSKKK